MRIENEILLDYSDVLIKPKRSSLNSRKEVDIEREFTFKYSGIVWKGIPIISANMDTSGTFEIAKEFMKYKMITSIHKFYSIDDWFDFLKEAKTIDEKSNIENYIIPSFGIKEREKLDELIDVYREFNLYPRFIMLDVANGYTERFVSFTKEIREEYQDITIIAGNVATAEGVEALIFAGADICKIGIGPGAQCFDKDTLVKTSNGNKKIIDVDIHDSVLTHTGKYKKVINKFKNENKIGKRIIINGVSSTEKHEYYVIEKKYKDVITDENIHEYAKWVQAKDLDKEAHFLLKNN